MVREQLSVESEIVAALRRIMRAVDQHSRQLLEEYGLTGPQLIVLQAAARLRGAPPSALAREIHLSRPTVTGILDRLEKRGLVLRSPHPRDRRSFEISVTPSGARMLAAAPSLLQDRFLRELASIEDWERSMMLSTLQRIAAMMDADTISAAPVLMTGPVAGAPASPDADPAPGPGATPPPSTRPSNGN